MNTTSDDPDDDDLYIGSYPPSNPIKKVLEVASHRNGVGGERFYVVKFISRETDDTMIGITFNEPEFTGTEYELKGIFTAVLDLELLSKGVIEFGENSWRGDQHHEPLQDAIRTANKED